MKHQKVTAFHDMINSSGPLISGMQQQCNSISFHTNTLNDLRFLLHSRNVKLVSLAMRILGQTWYALPIGKS